MADNNKHDLNDLTNHRLNSMEVHTLVSNLKRIELEKEIRDNPPEIAYFFDMLLGIAFIPIIVCMLWELLKTSDGFLEMLIGLLFVGGAFKLDLWYIRACWFEFTGK